MNRVAIVVLNWNGIDDTLECLDSLLKQSYKNYHILVVDNGSVDSSVKKLDKFQHNNSEMVSLVCNPRNFGFAGGVNTGIEWALNGDFDSVALINNDAIVDKKWLESLVSASSKKGVGITTGLLLHEDGKTIDSTGDWFSKWGLAFPRARNMPTGDAPKAGYVFGASGGSSLYSLEMIREIGFFDEDFFAYYEDGDISFRAQLAGWKVYYTPEAIAYHKQGATSKKIPGFTTYQTFKNLPLLFLKNVPRRLLLSVGIRFYLAYFLILINAIVKGNGAPALKGSWMAFILGFKKLPERWQIQRHRTVTDEYIRSIFWNDLPPDQTGIRKFRKLFTGK